MKRNVLSMGLSLLLVAVVVMGPVYAEEEKPTAELSVSALSRYICNGDELSRNSVVIQPQVIVGYKDFSLLIWGNLDTRPYLAETTTYKGDKRQNWTETDVKISYNKTLGPVRGGITYAYYGNAAYWNSDTTGAGPDQKDDQEVILSFGLNTLLSPTITAARSYDSTQRWYFTLGVSHSFPLGKKVSLNLAATGSYLISQDDARLKINDDGTDTKAGGSKNDRYNNFHDMVLSASLPIKMTQFVTVTPQVSYIFPLCADAKNDMKSRSMQVNTSFADREDSYLVGGLTVAFAF